MPCARKGQILFCKIRHSDSTKKLSETDNLNMLEFFIDNIMCYVWWTYFSTDSRHYYGYKVCLPICSFIRMRLHTGGSQEKRKEASPIL